MSAETIHSVVENLPQKSHFSNIASEASNVYFHVKHFRFESSNETFLFDFQTL